MKTFDEWWNESGHGWKAIAAARVVETARAAWTAALATAGDARWQPISEADTTRQIRVIGARPGLVIGDIYYGAGAIQITRMGEPGYTAERLIEAWRNTDSGDRLADHMQPTVFMPLPLAPSPENRP